MLESPMLDLRDLHHQAWGCMDVSSSRIHPSRSSLIPDTVHEKRWNLDLETELLIRFQNKSLMKQVNDSAS